MNLIEMISEMFDGMDVTKDGSDMHANYYDVEGIYEVKVEHDNGRISARNVDVEDWQTMDYVTEEDEEYYAV